MSNLSIYQRSLACDVTFHFLSLPSILICQGFALSLFLSSPFPPLFHQTIFFLVFFFSFLQVWMFCRAILGILFSSILLTCLMSIPNVLAVFSAFLTNYLIFFHFSFNRFISDSVFSVNSTDLHSASISTTATHLFSFSAILHASHPHARIFFRMIKFIPYILLISSLNKIIVNILAIFLLCAI